MMQANRLQELGEKLAQDYLTNGKDLNEGLDKVASTYGLNYNEIARVAEMANVKTHLGLIKQANGDEAYIEFKVADAQQIIDHPQKTAALISDYEKPPTKSFEKTASQSIESLFGKRKEVQTSPDYALLFKQAQARRESVDLMSNKCLEAGIKLNTALAPVYSVVKQAALSGTPTSSLHYIIKQAGEFSDYVIDYVQRDLKKDGILLENDLSKYASKRINEENELFKQAKIINKEINSLLKTATELQTSLDELQENKDPIEKVARRAKVGLTSTALSDVINYLGSQEKVAEFSGIDPEKLNNLIKKNIKRVDI